MDPWDEETSEMSIHGGSGFVHRVEVFSGNHTLHLKPTDMTVARLSQIFKVHVTYSKQRNNYYNDEYIFYTD